MSEDLKRLAKPFHKQFIAKVDKGSYKADFISHSTITQRLLANVGAFDFTVDQVIHGLVPAEIGSNNSKDKPRKRYGKPQLDHAIIAVLCTLTLSIDGEKHSITEVGECGDPHNWDHDGARLKDAISDGIKRCAMRFGVGLQLWTLKDPAGYFLYEALVKQDPATAELEAPVNPEPDPNNEPGHEPIEEAIVTEQDPEPAATAPPAEPPAQSNEPSMTPGQNRTMFALLNALGVPNTECNPGHDPGCRHQYVTEVLKKAPDQARHKTVESFKQLTMADAAYINEALKDIQRKGQR